MKNKMFKYPLLLGLIALVSGLLLAVVYNITNPIIEINKNKRENAIVLEMFGDSAKIEDASSTLNNTDKENGIYSVLEVTSDGKRYSIYKITIADSFDGDESSFVVAIDGDGKIAKLKFASTGDSYASVYNNKSYEQGVVGKSELDAADTVSGATKTGNSIIKAINAAISHQGRDK